ncbi:FimB/Mfa2 family fimbrial subunit [Bacteroides reticulotermitis]|uniref:FimB/Mfa2 family fimbrial subunit n=2 Tax=Bacteroides reticulotermitis TaxID=1133319 RepID=W4UTG4_9BACE|nr:FimB/Mfa2 family fimbrial subunit [Bacteroides reticulotermitis]MBB4045294.1 hypothetical protein [Bacteroides reticulotermitis]GAE84231.1 hypothetical protein JCM10512_2560 [Bacteroides reticulotermitis JCM 10512]
MKLQKTKFHYFLLFWVLMTGCINENLSECGEVVMWYFDYPYNSASFQDRIERVNVGIYSTDGILVESRQIEKDSLEAFRRQQGMPGMKVTLPLGEYTAVFWGNAHVKTKLDGWNNRNQGRVYHPDLGSITNYVDSDDSLYYAQQERFELKENTGPVKYIVHFEPGHINFEISVLGLKNLAVTPAPGTIPYIRMDRLDCETYDFNMNPVPAGEFTFYPSSKGYDAVRDLLTFCTKVHRMGNDNPVTISLIDQITDSALQSIILKEYIIRYAQYKIIPQKELTIYITFEIKKKNVADVEIIIHPLPWNKVNVSPITKP